MNKHIHFLLILFITKFCYSQSENELIKKIDSIAEIKGKYGISEGSINSTIEIVPSKKNKKSKIFNGQGGHSTTTYINYLDEEYYKTLSNEQKRKYIRKFELIKGKYHQAISYENSYNENIWSEFYYQNNQLFYIKIKTIRNEANKKDEIEYFEYSIEKLQDAKSIKNKFLFDVQSWIKEKNQEILKFFNSN
ncbi:hypothetical protein BWK63_09025 [Flavobacterium covae]|uniref:DUF4468 domain-containing protein n=1 Tax=Flavobacterium covae TaxID=2906076 RepID=A0ABW8PJ20_9FLAO|nr:MULTISPECIES: hypothetical protein [Flavobacterium]OWP80812.1 hypothetical protein BWK63_09025 [Flavobacterium covae]POR21893.1 hypothetical protein BWK57_08290 [Flavobacterium columnare]